MNARVRLDSLQPYFLKVVSPKTIRMVDRMDGCDGIGFNCPICWMANGGPVGTHHVICWRPHVPQTISPVPGRWEFRGTGYGDLSLVAGSSSVQLVGGCNAHFFVTNGEVILS